MATDIVTGVVRASYPHIVEKHAMGNSDPKYSIMLLLPKSDTETLKKMREVEKRTAQESKVYGGKVPPKLTSIITDGDGENQEGVPWTEKNPERAGHWFFSVRSNTRPGVVNAALEKIDGEEIYSGCYVKAALSCYAYNYEGKKGVSFGLNNLQFIRDGERLGGGSSDPTDDFDIWDDELI